MKNFKLFIPILISILFISCGKFPDGSSVWGGELWIVPSIFAVGVSVFGCMTVLQYRGGAEEKQIDKFGRVKWVDSKNKIPFYKLPYFIYTVICLILLIASIILVNAEK